MERIFVLDHLSMLVVACGYTGVTVFFIFQSLGNVEDLMCACVGAHHFDAFLIEGETCTNYLNLLGTSTFLRLLPS